MQKHQIVRFGTYAARVSGRDAVVIIESDYRPGYGWRATNKRTNRDVRIKSAARLRYPINDVAKEHAAKHPAKKYKPRPRTPQPAIMRAPGEPIAIPHEIADSMRRTLTANLIRYHVQQSINCPHCGAILDCRRAVQVDIIDAKADTSLKILIMCDACFERNRKVITETQEKAPGMNRRLEIHDGRAYADAGLL